jgi:tRNA A-37 threonylcarbamoyl transferase component Bud32
MTPEERWRRVQALCEQIESLPAGEQEAALAGAEPDEGVRAEVRELLAALVGEERARQEMDGPRAAMALPARIGEYAVTGLLGQGGTSTVYAALRHGQGVAVKVLHGYLNNREAVERFQREQTILTKLDHPGICRVLDAGITAEQQPYLVLDRVVGQPIDEYCNARRLGLAERIGLVVAACEAVGAAHRNLVVHLDLKPGNILVTADGHLRLLDFGTAKLLDPMGALTTTRHLTPLYASPEQLRGEAVTTACDVYGLGMVLFELLAGAGPYRSASIVSVAERAATGGGTVTLAEKATAEAAAERGMGLERLRRELRGDIETVVRKALAGEPGERYASAGDLAADLRRYLESRPVLAKRQTVGYRLQKYASRNRGAVAVTALLAMGLAGSLGYGFWQQRRALAEERRAATVGRFLDWMISTSNPNYGGRDGMTVVELAERAEERLAAGAIPDGGTAAWLEGSLASVLFQGGKAGAWVSGIATGVCAGAGERGCGSDGGGRGGFGVELVKRGGLRGVGGSDGAGGWSSGARRGAGGIAGDVFGREGPGAGCVRERRGREADGGGGAAGAGDSGREFADGDAGADFQGAGIERVCAGVGAAGAICGGCGGGGGGVAAGGVGPGRAERAGGLVAEPFCCGVWGRRQGEGRADAGGGSGVGGGVFGAV